MLKILLLGLVAVSLGGCFQTYSHQTYSPRSPSEFGGETANPMYRLP